MRRLLHGLYSSVASFSGARQGFRQMQLLPVFFLLAVAAFAGSVYAQTTDVVTQQVDTAQVGTLPNHLPLWANASNSVGVVPPNQMLDQMTIVLARSHRQELAFEKLLADQQNPASPDYHHWLTPEEVGERFGLSEHDITSVTGWLQSQGLHVNWVSPSRTFIGFGGSATDLGRAFQTELHYYQVNGTQHMSVSSDPKMPVALLPAIKAIRGLYTIDEHPAHHVVAIPFDSPDYTTGSNHYITPGDFAKIYDLPANLTGTGMTIGIVSWSRVNTADLDNFRLKTGTTFPDPNQVVPTAFGGIDPGPAYTAPPSGDVSLGGQEEATLDVVRAGSTAPGASLLLVAASPASPDDGIGEDAMYLVQTSPIPAQIMTISFGACESAAGPSGVDFWDALFKVAANEGISVFVSSGDSGASGCDYAFTTPPSNPSANSPNYICSSSYVTCVGGTEFADTSSPSTYWSSNNNSDLTSALSYIPEGAWNESSTSSVAASGGGVSTVIATPSWQTGTGVPAARSGRYTPDVAFSASGHNGYYACLAAFTGGSCVSTGYMVFSGTSAAAPGMAGVAALLDQKLGIAQGNLNPQIYPMAANTPTAFHDVTVSTSGVSSCVLSTPSMCNNSIPGPSGLSGGQAGFLVTTGYDEVTGLGSLDVQNFINNYGASSSSPPTTTATAPTVTVTPNPSVITISQALAVTVAVSGGASNPTPTGSVTLSSGSYSSVATTLSSGSASITVLAGSLAAGIDTLTASYVPDAASSSTYSSTSGSNSVTVTGAGVNFLVNSSNATFVVGATSGNTSNITVTPVGGFTGSVTLSAAVTSSPYAALNPTLSFGSTSPLSITGATPQTATLTITTTTPTAALAYPARSAGRGGLWFPAGGAALACILLFGIPAQRRRLRSMLGMLLLLVAVAGGMLACSSGTSGVVPTPSTTAGKYIVTVTATSGASTATSSFTLTLE